MTAADEALNVPEDFLEMFASEPHIPANHIRGFCDRHGNFHPSHADDRKNGMINL
jgi:hypothetical protein